MSDATSSVPWWTNAVIYQIYPLSFADANGDGHGDLRGIIERLPYLSETLGVDGIWLSPFYRSPMRDWGYDISDHTDVDPIFGDLHDAEEMIDVAHDLGLKVVVDYVINHTSDQHEWFLDSRSSRDHPRRDWYVWRDSADDGGPPNNWLSVFGGKAWTFDDATGQWYRHSFLKEQPDVNWRNPQAVEAMLDVVRFWLDRGVDGFRVDAAHQILKDPLERNNPPAAAGGSGMHKDMGEYDSQAHIYDVGYEDTHQGHRWFREAQDSTDREVLSVGEVHVFDFDTWAGYYGADLDEFTMPFNFHLMASPWTAVAIAETIQRVLDHTPDGAVTNWTLGNHDEQRLASRLPDGHERLAAMLLLTLGGTAFLYYGDELGMKDVDVPDDQRKDPWGTTEDDLCRDGARTPMRWSAQPYGGFSAANGQPPWLPLGPDVDAINVDSQLADETSVLNLYRGLLRLRRTVPALTRGSIEVRPEEEQVLRIVRHLEAGSSVEVLLNFTEDQVAVPCNGSTLLATEASVMVDDGVAVLPSGAGVIVEIA